MLATTSPTHLLVEAADGIASVTMNRPEKRNALSLELMRELIATFEALGDDRTVKAIVLRGNGPAFSAGHDLREMLDRSVADYRRVFDTCVKLMETIQSIPQPVIAEVAGVATAAGCQLVATCDLSVASSAATFATPGVKIGLFCTTPMVALTRAIGRKRAMEMLLTGKPIDAETAADWGLVNRVVPPEGVADAAARARAADRLGSRLRRRPRQGRVLRTDRPRPAQGVRVREGSDVVERRRRRRPGGHGRLRLQAPTFVDDITELSGYARQRAGGRLPTLNAGPPLGEETEGPLKIESRRIVWARRDGVVHSSPTPGSRATCYATATRPAHAGLVVFWRSAPR